MRGDAKNLTYGTKARTKMLLGARKVYKAVAAAYGPTSGNVAYQVNWGPAVFSHDGVSIAEKVFIKDEVEDIGAGMLVEASKKTNDISGDGTSATVMLGYHIMRLANQRIAAGFNPMALRRGIDKASTWAKEYLNELSTPIKDKDLPKVAAISAGDEEIGKLVADTVVKTKGVGITVEEYEGLGVIQEMVDGVFFEKGFNTPYLMTDPATGEAIHEDTYVLVTDKRINTTQDVLPILELVHQSDLKKVLIIGHVQNKALADVIVNHSNGALAALVVDPPVYGDQVLPFLEDIAIITGGKVLTENMPIQDIDETYLGKAEKVVATKDTTTILGGQGDNEAVQNRIDTLYKQIKDPQYTAFQRERMEIRLAKLQGKIGRIKVGGENETIKRELKFRIDDAIHATRAAREGGIVPGGATTLARLSVFKGLQNVSEDSTEQEGFEIVMDALVEPFKQLMLNAGEDAGYRLRQVLNSPTGQGFDVKKFTPEPIDLMAKGIYDPTLVIRSVIENACSVAGLAITTKAVITDDREYKLQQQGLNKT